MLLWALPCVFVAAGRLSLASNSFKRSPAPTAAAVIFPRRPATSPRHADPTATSCGYMADVAYTHVTDCHSLPVTPTQRHIVAKFITLSVHVCQTELTTRCDKRRVVVKFSEPRVLGKVTVTVTVTLVCEDSRISLKHSVGRKEAPGLKISSIRQLWLFQ